MSPISRGTPATDAYLDLQARARRENRSTQELQLYLLEGFLARLAASELREVFVLKGGVLLAAFDARRPTRDVDLAGVQIGNDAAVVLDLVRTVLDLDLDEDDGIEYDARGAVAEVIREEDEYCGVRVSADATLATARLSFHVDVNVGDPIWPAPELVAVPSLRGGPAIQLNADVLDGYVGVAQGRWSAWRRRSNSDHLPDEFADTLAAVIDFADPVLSGT